MLKVGRQSYCGATRELLKDEPAWPARNDYIIKVETAEDHDRLNCIIVCQRYYHYQCPVICGGRVPSLGSDIYV